MKKYFTPAEANRAIQLVSPIVKDILEKRFRAIGLTNEVKKLKTMDLLKEAELHEKLDAAEKLLDNINYNLRELELIGCLLKDTTLGTVDFPCRMGDREVFLCWRYGEPDVRFWHDTDSGYKNRKPLEAATTSTL